MLLRVLALRGKAKCGDRGVVDMRDQTRLVVKPCIAGLVPAP
eukprot:COSAG02_NODE_2007_length_10128_cov_5.313989_1_plen_41_part_10